MADDSELADAYDFACFMTHMWGFKRDDPRFTKLYESLMKDEHTYKSGMAVEEFIDIVINSDQSVILQKAFSHDLIAPGMQTFLTVRYKTKIYRGFVKR